MTGYDRCYCMNLTMVQRVNQVDFNTLWLRWASCSSDLFCLIPGNKVEIGFPASFAVKCGHRTEFFPGNTSISDVCTSRPAS